MKQDASPIPAASASAAASAAPAPAAAAASAAAPAASAAASAAPAPAAAPSVEDALVADEVREGRVWDETATDEEARNRRVPAGLFPLPALLVVTGHYGVGKTNLCLNLAIDAAARGQKPTLVDLDIVNPYFRSSDYDGILAKKGVKLIAPNYAHTTLDTPSLSGAIYTAVDEATDEAPLILDVGGDDVGATALGRFASHITARAYRMAYVVNHYRNLTFTPQEAADILREIEWKSHLTATEVVNNTHMKAETTAEMIGEGVEFASQTAHQLGLPVVCTTVPYTLLDALVCGKPGGETSAGVPQNAYPVSVYVRTPWDT